jgi:hypothetical protein
MKQPFPSHNLHKANKSELRRTFTIPISLAICLHSFAAEAAIKSDEKKSTPTVVAPSANSVTRTVGEAGDHIVTSREVRISNAVDQAMDRRPVDAKGYHVFSGQEPSFPGEVAHVLDEWVVELESKSLSAQAPQKTEVARYVKQVEDRWSGDSNWQSLDVGIEELNTMVERKITVRELEHLKSDPQVAPISDEDALEHYRKNRLRFGSLPFASIKDNIKEFLTKAQSERRLAEWHDVLRRKYKVRNFIAG